MLYFICERENILSVHPINTETARQNYIVFNYRIIEPISNFQVNYSNEFNAA